MTVIKKNILLDISFFSVFIKQNTCVSGPDTYFDFETAEDY